MTRPTFSLRFSDGGLRERVRVVAELAGISQNELLEQAAEHEVVARGALLADELSATAARLRAVTGPSMAEEVRASVVSFVEAEALQDPVKGHRISREADLPPRGSSQIGAVAAFGHG